MGVILKRVALTAFVLLAVAAAGVFWQIRDRHRGYAVDLCLLPDPTRHGAGAGPHSAVSVGFGRERITPDLTRPVWLAGFAAGRRATAIHDDLWAVAAVIREQRYSLAVVALDAIGLFHDDVIAIRERVQRSVAIDYVVITSTHTHSAPDLMGLWGRRRGISGVDASYRALVIERAARAVISAAAAAVPATLSLYQLPIAPEGLVADTRPPQVFDHVLRVMRFTRPGDGTTIGSIVNWANHPETPWSENTEVTADFPGYLREILEEGVAVDGQPPIEGWGGVHLYVNGAIGGLMTTSPETSVHDPYDGRTYTEPSHAKARAVARRLAAALLSASPLPASDEERAPRLTLLARTVELPVANTLFRLALAVGTVDRGQPRLNRLRTEVGLLSIGDASIGLVPGEVYPEIADGGIARLSGADFPTSPLEEPPLRELMPGRVKFLFGLANDAIGYIIPKAEWDSRAPWLDGGTEQRYGEAVSLGPETAPLLHRHFADLARHHPEAPAR